MLFALLFLTLEAPCPDMPRRSLHAERLLLAQRCTHLFTVDMMYDTPLLKSMSTDTSNGSLQSKLSHTSRPYLNVPGSR